MRIVATNRSTVVSAHPGNTRVVRTTVPLRMVVQGGRGPQGEAGDATALSRVLITLTAAVAVSALRGVRANAAGKADYCDAATPGDAGTCLGISANAADPAAALDVITQGLIADAGWAWTPGRAVYCGLNGALTQTPPSSATAAWSQAIGVAQSATRLIVNLNPTVVFA